MKQIPEWLFIVMMFLSCMGIILIGYLILVGLEKRKRR
jgi:hypothetical protein